MELNRLHDTKTEGRDRKTDIGIESGWKRRARHEARTLYRDGVEDWEDMATGERRGRKLSLMETCCECLIFQQ